MTISLSLFKLSRSPSYCGNARMAMLLPGNSFLSCMYYKATCDHFSCCPTGLILWEITNSCSLLTFCVISMVLYVSICSPALYLATVLCFLSSSTTFYTWVRPKIHSIQNMNTQWILKWHSDIFWFAHWNLPTNCLILSTVLTAAEH